MSMTARRVAAYFLAANRGKRSVAIDFSDRRGRGAGARRWRRAADVLVENFKVGGLAKFGLDAATLRAANPRLIYASITGFGQDGPYAARAGYDYIIQGDGRADEPDRPARRRAGRRADARRGRGRRPVHRHVHRQCDPRRAGPARRDGRGRDDRHGAVRHAIGDARQPGVAMRWSAARTRGGRAPGIPISCPTSRSRRATSRSSSRSATTGSSRSWRRSSGIAEWAERRRLSRPMPRGSPTRDTLVPMIAEIIAARPAARLAGDARGGGDSGGADQQRAARRWPIRRRCIAGRGSTPAAARSARCRWSARRSGSTATRIDAPLPPPALGEHGDLLGEWVDAARTGAAARGGDRRLVQASRPCSASR